MEITSDRAKKIVRKEGTFFTKNYLTPDGRIVTLAIGFKESKPVEPYKEQEDGTVIWYLPTTFGKHNENLNIGYSICVPGDDFKDFVGENRAISRCIKQDEKHDFIRITICEDMLQLLKGNSFACEGILNSAYKKFKKEKLPQLNARATQFTKPKSKDDGK